MNRIATIALALALIAGAAAFALAADELTVDQIVDNALRVSYYQGATGRADVKMTITDSQERTRERELTILRRDDVPEDQPDEDDLWLGDQKFYVYFHRPADVRKMAFLVHKHINGEDDRKLYLPALDLAKPIASSEERTSFAGSHFFYEDVSGRNKDEDTHELVETTDNYYVLKNTPKNPDAVEFSYYKMWIHKKTFLVIKTEYYDKNDEKYREYQALKFDSIQDYSVITKARMSDTRIGGHTEVEYSDVRFNIELPDDVFTERYLRRAPVKYLR